MKIHELNCPILPSNTRKEQVNTLHMNTPDTEKKCCEMCERHAGIPPTKRMSQLHGTPFCGDTNCPCHTPDTEDWEKSKNEFMQKWMYSERLCCNGDYCTAHCAEDKWKEIEKLLTSQTTYWLERVEGERERYKKLLRYHYEHYGIESVKELITNKDNLK